MRNKQLKILNYTGVAILIIKSENKLQFNITAKKINNDLI